MAALGPCVWRLCGHVWRVSEVRCGAWGILTPMLTGIMSPSRIGAVIRILQGLSSFVKRTEKNKVMITLIVNMPKLYPGYEYA